MLLVADSGSACCSELAHDSLFGAKNRAKLVGAFRETP